MTEYESLYVGMTISEEDLNKWSKIGNNFYDGEVWSKWAYGTFHGDRQIVKFDYVAGKNCIQITGTIDSIKVNAEGLSEFLGLIDPIKDFQKIIKLIEDGNSRI